MKLHRLRLENFRGVTERELTFPDAGVVVVTGRNEIGKTSMIDALDALIALPDSSRKRSTATATGLAGAGARAPSGAVSLVRCLAVAAVAIRRAAVARLGGRGSPARSAVASAAPSAANSAFVR